MFGSDGVGAPYPRVPLGLNLEQARELDRGNALYQLQQSYQTLSREVTHVSTGLREVLAHLRGGHERAPKGASLTNLMRVIRGEPKLHARLITRPNSPKTATLNLGVLG